MADEKVQSISPSNGATTTAEPSTLEVVKEGKQAWLQVLAAFCLNLNTWGFMNSYGVFQTYYTLELLRTSSASSISWIGSVQAFLMFVVSFIIGPIFDAGYLRSLLVTGALLSVIGLFMTSLCTAYWQLMLAQGLMMGLGFGCSYLPAPALVSMYFQKNQSLAIGLSSVGAGIGGVVFPLVFTRLLPRIGFGWTTRVLAFIMLVTAVLPIVIMRLPRPHANGKEIEPSSAPQTGSKTPSILLKLLDLPALKDWPYTLCNIGLLTGFMGMYVVLYYINLFALKRTRTNTDLASYMLIIANGASILGRIGLSALADIVGAAKVLASTALLAGIMAFASLAVRSGPEMVAWSIFFGAGTGAFMGLAAAGVATLSSPGAKIGVRLGMTLGTVGCGVLVAEPIAGAILDGTGGWVGLIGWCGVLLSTGSISMCIGSVLKKRTS